MPSISDSTHCRSDAETGGDWEEGSRSRRGLRQRRRAGAVGPSPSEVASTRTTTTSARTAVSGDREVPGREQRHRRTHVGVMGNILSYLLLP